MKYGLVGEKLGHSFSKEIHERIASYEYELCEVSKSDIDKFFSDKQFNAINVTIPYKETVIKHLSYIDERAKKIHAVNTVVNKNGKLYGYNTDYLGLKSLIEKEQIEIKNKKVIILGTGGTSKTATAVLEDMNVGSIVYASINKEGFALTYSDVIKYHSDADVIINTTPCGMYPNVDGLIIDINHFKNLEAVCDVIYNPLNTSLIRMAKARGLKTASGLYMLVAQAVFASGIFLDKEVDVTLIDEVYKEIKNKKENIVLIGMPTCGKSTIGKIIAEKLGKTFVDTDCEIEKVLQMPIKDYLNQDTLKEFRMLEASIIKKLSVLNNLVISTGGGIVEDNMNIYNLKANGKIIFIDRDIELLFASDSRPLSKTKEELTSLYERRYPLYNKAKDLSFKNNKELADIVNDILKEVK